MDIFKDRDGTGQVRMPAGITQAIISGLLLAALATLAASLSGWIAAWGVCTLIFLGAFVTGALLGFIFGIPRTMQDPSAAGGVAGSAWVAANNPAISTQSGDSANPPAEADKQQAAAVRRRQLLQSNSNLERISDWLTTLLVGAGLVQLHALNDGLYAFRMFLEEEARVFGTAAAPTAGVLPTLGTIALIFGVACGFLYMYLSTRLVLVGLFQIIEERLAGGVEGERLTGSTRNAVTAASLSLKSPGHQGFMQELNVKRTNLTTRDALNTMFDLLYKPDPAQAIQIGATLANTQAVYDPDYWFYLAAAFGQQMQQFSSGSEEWESNRDNALDCARRAVAIDRNYRSRLRVIADPEGSDRDLAGLWPDDEFQRLVGRG